MSARPYPTYVRCAQLRAFLDTAARPWQPLFMELRVLGSGTAIPHRQRGASGYALVVDGVACLLECGPGSTRRWPAADLDFESVRLIAVSHHHVDHCSDLPAVLFGRNVPSPPVETPLTLAGPVGHRAHIEGLEGLFGRWVSGAHDTVELPDGSRLERAPFVIEARTMHHCPGAIGMRVRADGKSVAFSGDSGPCEALVELCRGVDVALIECSYPAGYPVERHLTTETAAQTAVSAGVSRLVLTHFYPACDAVDLEAEVRSAGYEGELILATDGLRIQI